ncbi:hypothetical protein EON65_08000 [archaeon]|nr:MAG: hypothetical protein EON65_08000 [archaeon]
MFIRLLKSTGRQYSLRHSYWKDTTNRISEDVVYDLAAAASSASVLDISQHVPLHNNNEAVELYLFTDIIDTTTCVPIAWGASRVLLLNTVGGKTVPKEKDTIVVTMNEDVTKFNIQMRLNSHVDGLKLDSAFLLTLELSTTQQMSVQNSMHYVRPFPQYSVHWVQGLYPKLDRIYATIEDILLAPVRLYM